MLGQRSWAPNLVVPTVGNQGGGVLCLRSLATLGATPGLALHHGVSQT